MAMIYNTTMEPGKLELVSAWLPTRPWYVSTGPEPALARSGGFRLDDPEGEVGIEFMVLTDTSGGRETSYLVPLTYRGGPLAGAGAGLVGTSEHGVLGKRWIYDGAHDPVLVGQLLALLQGRAVAQDQCDSDVPDPSVTALFDGPEIPAPLPGERPEVRDTARGTDVVVAGARVLGLTRLLRPGAEARGNTDGHGNGHGHADPDAAFGRLTAGWTAPDGAAHRGLFATLRSCATDTA
ncbi:MULTISPECIES: 1,4-alpha-glucan branching protein [unclassified Streptomyces]|uniref:maltokinase N-terminal cap-like domain-containing protein n=1 Tax=unclassified Streptomyces TaxID=2593676 RepID=UPI000DC7CFE1|nr:MULTISPECIES: 1,4-alpha-glucan branching protein [unclassified Streptomyces]AWZ07341.1 1,4-alpha-glucan branching protein [Streptomyces sp. ICC4]AWZ15071.1 1,4-alpha-glucan branching protein [Streptomyces sp. ICC1]